MQNINKYYVNKMNEISKQIDINKEPEYVFSDNIVEIYIDDNIKIKAKYVIVGMYNIPMSMWYWGWNIAFVNKKLVISGVKDFINILNKDYAKYDQKEIEELYYLVNNDNYYISHNNLEKVIKLALYLTKGVWIFPVKNDTNMPHEMNRITYILITKILQYT